MTTDHVPPTDADPPPWPWTAPLPPPTRHAVAWLQTTAGRAHRPTLSGHHPHDPYPAAIVLAYTAPPRPGGPPPAATAHVTPHTVTITTPARPGRPRRTIKCTLADTDTWQAAWSAALAAPDRSTPCTHGAGLAAGWVARFDTDHPRPPRPA